MEYGTVLGGILNLFTRLKDECGIKLVGPQNKNTDRLKHLFIAEFNRFSQTLIRNLTLRLRQQRNRGEEILR